MRHTSGVRLVAAAGLCCAACPKDGINGDDGGDDAPDADPNQPDADVGDSPCDMSGRWIAEQHTVSVALGSDQNTTNYLYFEITQTGDAFTIDRALHCGFVVDGTTTVTIDDATLAALAAEEMAGQGRAGTYAVSGDQCAFDLDRIYNLRGADKAMFLTSHWQVGDADKALSAFPALPSAPPGMEDWDGDNMDGITLRTGLGNRYVCQRDWNEHHGMTPQYAPTFGGVGAITVQWDSQEGISEQTTPLLRTTATPSGDGWARYARAGSLELGATDLETCRNVQQLASQVWP
jgi:hypothetical protein